MHSWRVHAASLMMMMEVIGNMGRGGGALGEEVWRARDVEAHGYLLDGGPGIGPIVKVVGRGRWYAGLCRRGVHMSILSMSSACCEDGVVGHAPNVPARVSLVWYRRTCASSA